MKSANIPVLDGWTSLPVAAARLDVTRQRLFQMVDEEKLTSVRQVLGAGSRPAAYVVGEAELCRLRRAQLEAALTAATAAEPEEAAALRKQLAEVQLDAVRLLHGQLEAAADAADVAGDARLARTLRRQAAGLRAPAAV